MGGPELKYRPADGVLRAEIDGQEVLLNTDTGIYHLVNPTGRSLLVLLEEGRELDECVSQIASRTGEEPARVSEDAARFIRAMCDRGLLVAAS
jgi:hypothetical protein